MRRHSGRINAACDCFNPRTRGGCDPRRHSQDRGAFLFQSTHPRGVRLDEYMMPKLIENGFNPRTRGGCDPPPFLERYRIIIVSIHAPAGGATWLLSPNAQLNIQFQSTHPRGVRLSSRDIHAVDRRGFNPRTRGGCDVACNGIILDRMLFQSTHPRGVRRRFSCPSPPPFLVSIHAPAGGATCLPMVCLCNCQVSIHAPAGGAT